MPALPELAEIHGLHLATEVAGAGSDAGLAVSVGGGASKSSASNTNIALGTTPLGYHVPSVERRHRCSECHADGKGLVDIKKITAP